MHPRGSVHQIKRLWTPEVNHRLIVCLTNGGWGSVWEPVWRQIIFCHNANGTEMHHLLYNPYPRNLNACTRLFCNSTYSIKRELITSAVASSVWNKQSAAKASNCVCRLVRREDTAALAQCHAVVLARPVHCPRYCHTAIWSWHLSLYWS